MRGVVAADREYEFRNGRHSVGVPAAGAGGEANIIQAADEGSEAGEEEGAKADE